MYEGHKIAAVVPAFKEEAHIARVVTTMPDIVDIIIVVDDCSPDATYDRAVETNDPRLTVIRHEENQGVGGAIMTAHAEAMRQGADIDVVFAGDGQMDPAYLPALLDPIVHDGYGFTKANRFYSSTSFRGMPAYRVFGNIVLSFLNKMASGYWNLFDPQNGYTATSRKALERLDFDPARCLAAVSDGSTQATDLAGDEVRGLRRAAGALDAQHQRAHLRIGGGLLQRPHGAAQPEHAQVEQRHLQRVTAHQIALQVDHRHRLRGVGAGALARGAGITRQGGQGLDARRGAEELGELGLDLFFLGDCIDQALARGERGGELAAIDEGGGALAAEVAAFA